MAKGRILVVDDDAFSRAVCTDILTEGGFVVTSVSDGSSALDLIEADEPVDIVITDLVMPGISGIEVIERAKRHNTLIDVIMITGHGSMETAIAALKNGAFDYIKKPVDDEDLLLTVNNCMEKKKLIEENIEIKQSLRLFEVSRAITSTIDISRFYNNTLDAFMQMIPADIGMLVFYNDDGSGLDIKAVRHLGLDSAEAIVGFFKNNYEESLLKPLRGVTVIPMPNMRGEDRGELGEERSIMVAPFLAGGKDAGGDGLPVGFVLLFSPLSAASFSEMDLQNAGFIAEHASEAFYNARKYVEAKEMAFIDSLTNLYNSKYLDAALDREIKRADRLRMPVTVLFMDLDDFKRVNDTNDHLVGSKVLVEVAEILLKCVREVDIVIRYGGDEYVVILVDADTDSAFAVAERIRHSIETNSFLAADNLDIRTTMSIGVATYPSHTRDKRQLLRMADKAMYSAKGMSKNPPTGPIPLKPFVPSILLPARTAPDVVIFR
jgi:diguanylate cyclase (GGDEF)-like protein